MNNRPRVTARAYDWKSGTNAIPGIGVIHQRRITGHLTEQEARTFADHLHDLADELAARRQSDPQPATPAENE